ncbi:endolytic transglycosylase MltG [Candidatus Foliamicus sp.]
MTGRAHLAAAASVLALLAAAGLFIARLALGSPLAPDSVERIVIVEAGDSFGAVASNLAESEIVERPGLFKLAAFLRGAAGRIQAGEYRIRFGDTHRALLERMMRGEVVQHYFTIVEGWTVSELLRALSAEDLLAQTLKSSNPEELACEMNLGYAHAEGLFFPDTYAYTRGETDAEVLLRAHAMMEDKLLAAWTERSPGLPLADPYEVLILASIVERETALDAERPVVAGVLTRRLEQNMRLQVDPTVIYGLGAAYAGNITRAHLRGDTPYNTYTRHGLPPTPISLPGEESLRAAAKPRSGSYLYYAASAALDGSHVFSDTLAEHNAAVASLVRTQRALRRQP